MNRSSISYCHRLRYSIYSTQLFHVFQPCSANHCTELLTASSHSKISHVNSQMFEESKILSKWILGTNHLRMSQTYTGALIDKTFHYDTKLRRKDKISNDFILIYRVPDDRWFRMYGLVGVTLFVISPWLVIRSFYKTYEDEVVVSSAEIMEAAGNDVLMMTDTEYSIASLLLLFVSVSFYMFVRRFPLRIYYNEKTYIAVFMNSYFPLLNTIHAFPLARKYRIPALFPKSLYLFGRRRARLFNEYFRRPIDKVKMTKENSVDD